MKYIKLFNTDSDRVSYEGSENYIGPYVSYVKEDDSVHYGENVTYWAYEYESGKLLLGNFHDNVINVESDSENVWVVDAEGVYREQTTLQSSIESECLDAINAKYGTSYTDFTILQVSGIAIGDDCPNWEEYEKIEMPKSYIRLDQQFGSLGPIGVIENDIFKMSSNAQTNIWLCLNNGEIVNETFLGETAKNNCLRTIQHYFPDVKDIELFVENYTIGDVVKVVNYPYIS